MSAWELGSHMSAAAGEFRVLWTGPESGSQILGKLLDMCTASGGCPFKGFGKQLSLILSLASMSSPVTHLHWSGGRHM